MPGLNEFYFDMITELGVPDNQFYVKITLSTVFFF